MSTILQANARPQTSRNLLALPVLEGRHDLGAVLTGPSGVAYVELSGSQSEEGAKLRHRQEGVGEQLATDVRKRRVNLTVHFGDEGGAGGHRPLTQLREPFDCCFVVAAGKAERDSCPSGDGGRTCLVRGPGAAQEKAGDAPEPAQPDRVGRADHLFLLLVAALCGRLAHLTRSWQRRG